MNPRALLLALALCCAPAMAQTPPAQAAASPAAPNTTPPGDAPAAPDQAPADDTEKKIKLPNVNVEGKRNVFNDNDKKLKELKDSLPCAGCDAKPHTHKKLVRRVLDAVGERVLPTEAPDHSTLDANDKAQDLAKEHLCGPANMNGCVPDNVKP